MFKSLSKIEKIILVAIMLLAFVLIFFRLTRADLQGDDAHYAFRSIGYIDYMSSQLQTTPLQWFNGDAPWWQKLSFHDHPPLFFLTQHIFFKIFDVSDFVAKLPSAFFGWLLILVIFFIGRELYNNKIGLIAALVLTVSNYHLWLSRMGYLESLLMLMVALSILFLLQGRTRSKKLLLAGLFLGLAMLTKYTAFLVIPVFLITGLIYKQEIWKNKKFWLGFLIAFFIFLPVIFYNLMLFKTRGHMDVQFTALLGQSTADWEIIAGRSNWADHNFFSSLITMFKNLGDMISWPLMIVFLFSLVYLIWEYIIIRKNPASKKHLFLLSFLAMIILFFLIIGANAGHYLAPFNLIIALIISRAILSCYDLLKINKVWRCLFLVILALLFFFNLIFTYNTNNRLNKSPNSWLYSPVRLENLGFQPVAKFLQQEFKNKVSTMEIGFSDINRFNPLANSKNFKIDQINNSLYVFDDNTLWFPRLWYMERWRFYNFFTLIETGIIGRFFGEEAVNLIKNSKEKELYLSSDKKESYYLKSQKPYQQNKGEYLTTCPDLLTKNIEQENNITRPAIELKNKQGEVVFKVYKFINLKNLIICF